MRALHVVALSLLGMGWAAGRAEAFYANKATSTTQFANLTMSGGGGFSDNISNCDNCGKWVKFSDVVDFTEPNKVNGFQYYGTRFEYIWITSNGYVQLSEGFPSGNPTVLTEDPAATGFGVATGPGGGTDFGQANGSIPSYTIAPLWDDWDTTGTQATGGDVVYGAASGVSNPCFAVRWRKVRYKGAAGGDGNGVSFALLLCKDGSIEYLYGDVADGSDSGAHDNGKSSIIGFQWHNATVAERVASYQANSAPSNTSVRWTHPGLNLLFVRTTGWDGNRRFQSRVQILDAQTGNFQTVCATGANSAWRRFSYVPATNPQNNNNYNFQKTAKVILAMRDADDKPQANVPLAVEVLGQGELNAGSFQPYASTLVYKFNKITPQPFRSETKTTTYPDGLNGTSRVDYYRFGNTPPNANTMLFISGFDPLDATSGATNEGETNTAHYLGFLGDIASSLFTASSPGTTAFNIAIADFAIGDEPLPDLVGEIGWFVEQVRVFSGRSVQVAGMSMGGTLLLHALSANTGSIRGKIAAYYSVDSPLRGANLNARIQALITCGLDASNPTRKKMRSRAARNMLMSFIDNPNQASCNLPSGSVSATMTTSFADTYYNSWFVFPPETAGIKRFAVVLGDAEGTTFTSLKSGGGSLLTIDGSLGDGTGQPSKRDCAAGSRYVTSSQVNGGGSFSDLGWFAGLTSFVFVGLPDLFFNTAIYLNWEPAFINIDSALGTDCLSQDFNDDNSCAGTYTSTSIAGSSSSWTGVITHNVNAYHGLPPDSGITSAVKVKVNCIQAGSC